MKNIRIIALILCVLMIASMFVACNNNQGDDTTTTTTSSTTSSTQNIPDEPVKPTSDLVVADLKFETENEEVADGFTISAEGGVVVKDGALKVENGHGGYFISDDELVLNYENYETISFSFDFKFDKFSSGNASLISPLFCDEEHVVAGDNDKGYIYQMFLKVNNDGGLYFWSSKHKWVDPITFGGQPFKIKEGQTYNLSIEYDIAYGSYEILLDGITLVTDSLTTVMDHEYMTGFTMRFFDANEKIGAYSATIDNLKIVACP